MPKFMEDKLKKQYGADSDIPYKIMNRMGLMRGSKTTAQGRKMQKKHDSHEEMRLEAQKRALR